MQCKDNHIAKFTIYLRVQFKPTTKTITAALLGLVVVTRLCLLFTRTFPLGDGGFFYAIVESMAYHGQWWQAYVEFNGQSIPFAYPPLGFWIAALLVKAGIPPLKVFLYKRVALSED